MPELKGKAGELRMTIEVKRAATGKVETYEFVGALDPDQLAALEGEAKRNRDHGAAGSIVGPGSSVSNQPKEN